MPIALASLHSGHGDAGVIFSTCILSPSTLFAMESRPRKLLDQVRDAIRLKHYSCRTEQTYVGWIRRYILYS